MEALLTVNQLEKSFLIHAQNKWIPGVAGITLQVKRGQFISIQGKSGSGKSTILKCIYRTYLPQAGEIIYESSRLGTIDLAKATDREMLYLRRYEIGYVSQFLNILPRVTARELVEQSMAEQGVDLELVKPRAEEMLTHFELDPTLWDHYPNTFSGGEKLRLNLARAMVKRPELLLLDEPTASLDDASKKKVKDLIFLLKEQGTTMIGIFHDEAFSQAVSDVAYRLADGALRLVERGTAG